MISCTRNLAVAFCCIFIFACPALAIQASLSPDEIFPGDPFIVKISGVPAEQNIGVSVEGKEIPMGRCGDDCLMGIGVVDIETKPGENRVLIQSGDRQASIPLLVKKPEFPEIHLKLPKEKVIPDAETLERIKREDEKLKQIWQQRTDIKFRGSFITPLPNPVGTGFGVRRIMNDEFVSVHRGIDIKGTRGEKVAASNSGRVVLAEDLFFGGNTIIIDHGQGIYSIYMHLDRFAVNMGALVSKGDVIGYVGSTGRATGPHLHFGIKIMSSNVNPLSFLQLKLE
jgi:murein DD-endopeptidase MepM/ murein hydrolase activator NlpD